MVDWGQGLVAMLIVLALVGGCAWLLRRGSLGSFRRRPRLATTETVALLGDRRSLVVVTIEGRRLLVGLTPVQVSLLTELRGTDSFAGALDAASGMSRETTT